MNNTVRFALREVIINEALNLSDFTRRDALDELIRQEREEVQELNAKPNVWNASMTEFREHRMQGNRIATIKLIRERLSCGLSEALIICAGIESRFDIK